ncbi:major facilitator superfamily domain-containing protein [Chaetomium strumarium]|uniref:Major facilitator superfamily domain-containing protein n=1 Tax=Chaetomium strumarium TaxID=1170767 RepID=A0AAJ0GUD0_9PEZI|nr:major facilitator superfamily domain-containing protein [Chaetomium strumarium]
MAVRHDVRSHAREDDVPGTVNLQAQEGEETHYGQALYPVPSPDPNDPLQWPRWKKHMIMFCCCAFSFLGNSALLGPATYIGLWAAEFGVDQNTAAGLVNYPNLVFGFGSIVLIPLYRKIGRRPVMLLALVLYAAGVIGAAEATTYSGLMGARIVHGFGSGVCEALPVQLVNDIFFLHERGKKLGWYTIALCLGATGPMFSGFMLAAGLSWHLFFYVEFAFAGALLILAFFFVEETMYFRESLPPSNSGTAMTSSDIPEHEDKAEEEEPTTVSHHELSSTTSAITASTYPPRKTFFQQLRPFTRSAIDHKPWSAYVLMPLRAITYLLIPSTFWVITTYGIFIGLCGFSFNFVFPLKIVAPPYNWPQTSSGLSALATLVGFALAVPFLPASDILAARLTKRNGGIREAEMRLGVLFPALLAAPAGQVLFGVAAERDLHWICYFVAIALTQWAGYWYFTVTLAYAVDSHNANLSEQLIVMNLGKQAISFGFGLEVLNWILKHGYLTIIVGAFMPILVVNNLMVVVFMIWGKRIRLATARSWLARFHAKTVVEGESH